MWHDIVLAAVAAIGAHWLLGRFTFPALQIDLRIQLGGNSSYRADKAATAMAPSE